MTIQIALLADHPALISQLAAAYEQHMPDWYRPGGRGDARTDLEARARRDGLPCALVAFEGEVAIGTCALGPVSMSLPAPFGAWLLGLWVASSHRRRGIAVELVRAAAAQAVILNISEVRSGTVAAPGVFLKAGWSLLEPIVHDGVLTQVFSTKP